MHHYEDWADSTGNRDITRYAETYGKLISDGKMTDEEARLFLTTILMLIATDIFDITSEELASLAVFGKIKPDIHKYYLSYWTQDVPDDYITDYLFVAGIEERGPDNIWYAICTTLVADNPDHAWEVAGKVGLKIVEKRFINEKPFSWSMNTGKSSDAALKRIDFLTSRGEDQSTTFVHDADYVPEESVGTDDWMPPEDD